MTYMQLTGEGDPTDVAVSSFVANLPELLGAMRRDPRCLVAICDFTDFRYVQFWAEGDVIIAECISNLNLTDEMALTPDQEAQLESSGWAAPSRDGSPNWSQRICDVSGIGELSRAVAHVVTDILGQGSTPDGVMAELRTFEVRRSPSKDMEAARHDSRRNREQLDAAAWESIVGQFDDGDFSTDGTLPGEDNPQ
jgi:hypothetical protein